VIDLHAHVVLEQTLGAAGRYGPDLDEGDPATGRLPCYRVGDYELLGVRYRHSAFMDVDRRLEEMDERGIDLQVLSPNPLTFFHHIDSTTAIAFSRRHNDGLAEIVGHHRERLAGLAQLPMQDPARAVEELHRSVSELGLLGAYIGTDLGRPLDDPAFDVLYRACIELDVPLFIHPAPGGIDAPRRDERLARFDADLWLGFAHEEALAVATLVLGGVLARHEELDVCVSHGGGSTPWLAERMRHAATTRPWADAALRSEGGVEARLARLWWDAHVGGPRALAMLVAAAGTDRLVGGTNFAGWDETADPSYGDASLAATLDANARRLLRLPPGVPAPGPPT
jgi:aminocarboxymuconate-semialdehyde decarboxylase